MAEGGSRFGHRCVVCPNFRMTSVNMRVWIGSLAVFLFAQSSTAKKTKSTQVLAIDKGWYLQAKTGHQICPCSCMERNDESSYGSYWKEKYGQERGDIACGTDACLVPAGFQSELGMCKEIVDYTFCPRKVMGWNTTDTNAFVKQLAADAFGCWDITTWDEGTECDKAVIKGACYAAFPRCESLWVGKTSAKKICRSTCQYERVVCRNGRSAYGPRNWIRDMCAVCYPVLDDNGEEVLDENGVPKESCPFAEMDGPDNECTGGAELPSAFKGLTEWSGAIYFFSIFVIVGWVGKKLK